MHALLTTVADSIAALMLAAGARAESPATGETHDRSIFGPSTLWASAQA